MAYLRFTGSGLLRGATLLSFFALGGLLTGCQPNTNHEATLTVFAASSLREAFDDVATEFSAQHPEVHVAIQYAGSTTLVQQVSAGAPADVIATAHSLPMDTAQQARLLADGTRQDFAQNTLVGVVPAGNPANVTNLEDTSDPEVNLVVCAPQVPCGVVAHQLAADAGVVLQPVSEEQQVGDVLGKVLSGQADAGLVYATDATIAGHDVETFELPDAALHPSVYSIAQIADAHEPERAQQFIDLVMSNSGQTILTDHAFQRPTGQ